MTDEAREEVSARLAHLARATESVRARPGFAARVHAALALDTRLVFGQEVVRSARRLAPFALVLALASGVLAATASPASSVDLAVAERTTLELAW